MRYFRLSSGTGVDHQYHVVGCSLEVHYVDAVIDAAFGYAKIVVGLPVIDATGVQRMSS